MRPARCQQLILFSQTRQYYKPFAICARGWIPCSGRMTTDEHRRFYVELGKRVERARRRRGLTQEKLATAINLTRTSVVNVEKGRQRILSHTLVDLMVALNVKADELLPPSP